MNYKLISLIVKGAWAIEQRTALAMGPSVFSLMKGKPVEFKETAERPYLINALPILGIDQNVAVIPVKGILMKDNQECGPMGTAGLGELIKNADADPNISAIILDTDTPGGSVDGIESFGNIIKNTKKPVVTFVNGLMASAGMWMGSNSDKIIASTGFDEVGSIGVMLSLIDIKPMWEKEGVKFHEIYADQSPDKNADYKNILNGEYTEYIQSSLNPLAEKFQNVIRENRPNVTEDQLTGKTYFAKDVIGTLIDGIGTMEYAVQEALNLANVSNLNTNIKMSETFIQDEKSFKNWFQRVFGLRSVEDIELEKKESEMQEMRTKAEKLTEIQDELKKAQDTIEELKNTIDALKQQPGAETINVIKATDGTEDANPALIRLPEGDITEQFEAFKAELNSYKK
jgi:protease-4